MGILSSDLHFSLTQSPCCVSGLGPLNSTRLCHPDSPTSQHNCRYPAGTRCWHCRCCALWSAAAAVPSAVCPLEVTSVLSSASDGEANNTHPESWEWIAVCPDHVEKVCLWLMPLECDRKTMSTALTGFTGLVSVSHLSHACMQM